MDWTGDELARLSDGQLVTAIGRLSDAALEEVYRRHVRAVISLTRATSAGRNGRMLTTSGPRNGPARRVRRILPLARSGSAITSTPTARGGRSAHVSGTSVLTRPAA